MPIESILTRELDIRFIDARKLLTEAKINLGVNGYPSTEQENELHAEAIRIFNGHNDSTRCILREQKRYFEKAKLLTLNSASNHESSSESESDSGAPPSDASPEQSHTRHKAPRRRSFFGRADQDL